MKETLLLDHLEEPHYITSAWRNYDGTYILFPKSGALFSVRHWFSEAERSKYIDNVIDSYTAIYEAQNLTFDATAMAIGQGKRGNVYTIAAWLYGGNLDAESMQDFANKAAEHHAKAVYLEKI